MNTQMLLRILASVERLRQVQQLVMEQQISFRSLCLQINRYKTDNLQNHLINKK